MLDGRSIDDAYTLLGLDPDNIKWQDFALCDGQPTSEFYEEYETNPRLAATIDEECLSCPIMKQCLLAGIDNKEWGVWGGIYLTSGTVDQNKNSHKTKETWIQIRKRVGSVK